MFAVVNVLRLRLGVERGRVGSEDEGSRDWGGLMGWVVDRLISQHLSA